MMKKTVWIFIAVISGTASGSAQQFIDRASIEFEVKKNLQKTLGGNIWEEMLKENMPVFKTAYYQYTFSGSKSLYKLDHFDEREKIPDWMKKDEEENEWYTDQLTSSLKMRKSVVGTEFFINDSLPKIEWKLSNENRVIAGFNCRKATGKIFDSVYVFAFYTDEITISGGPCSIGGLPGMILGMTIPRLYTSWIATKVTVASVNESIIKPAVSKKIYPKREFISLLTERTKDWGSYYEDKNFLNLFLWESLL
jgi:GLPGLI family protein